MSILVLYICATFFVFSILSMILLNYTFSKRNSISRYMITSINIMVSVDTCLYLNDCGWFINNLAVLIQDYLKKYAGIIFLNINSYTEYAISIVTIYCLYLVVFSVEFLIAPTHKSYSIRTYRNEAKHKPAKSLISSISSLVSIICSITTTLIALLTFLFKLK